MFEHWGEFYLLAGSAAAVLIGLIFVVVTLMQDRTRSSVIAGSRLYMGPVLLNISFVLVLSAAALVPGINAKCFALVSVVVAAWALVRGVMSVLGIAALKEEVHWTDLWFYGVAPTALALLLATIAFAFWSGFPWAQNGLAAVIVAMVLLAVRNEWDLVTWLAPRADSPEPSFYQNEE